MATEEKFMWRGKIFRYQCDLIPVKSNTLASNLDGINLSSLFLNGWIYLIVMFTSYYLLPIDSNTMAPNLYGVKPIFIFELMDIPYFHVHIPRYIPCIYTHILQISCAVICFWYEHRY